MIRAATAEEIRWFSNTVGYSPSENAKGIVKDDLEAMVLYDYWSFNAVQVHIYSSGPKALFDDEFLHEIFHYPFEQCGRGLLLAVTPADQKASLAVSKYLGFVDKYRIKDGWKVGVDMVIREMRKDECKWLNNKEAA